MFPPVPTADLAFDWLVDAAYTHSMRYGSSMEKIDNPYGAPWFDLAGQRAVLAREGLSWVPVTIKGA